jgi:hypothetical protein
MNGMLEGQDGSTSSKRVSSFVCLVLAVGLSVYGVVAKYATVDYVLAFLGAALAFQGVSVAQEVGMNRFPGGKL